MLRAVRDLRRCAGGDHARPAVPVRKIASRTPGQRARRGCPRAPASAAPAEMRHLRDAGRRGPQLLLVCVSPGSRHLAAIRARNRVRRGAAIRSVQLLRRSGGALRAHRAPARRRRYRLDEHHGLLRAVQRSQAGRSRCSRFCCANEWRAARARVRVVRDGHHAPPLRCPRLRAAVPTGDLAPQTAFRGQTARWAVPVGTRPRDQA